VFSIHTASTGPSKIAHCRHGKQNTTPQQPWWGDRKGERGHAKVSRPRQETEVDRHIVSPGRRKREREKKRSFALVPPTDGLTFLLSDPSVTLCTHCRTSLGTMPSVHSFVSRLNSPYSSPNQEQPNGRVRFGQHYAELNIDTKEHLNLPVQLP
jgi:hypothetical protein